MRMATAPGEEATKWIGEPTAAPGVGDDTATSARQESEDKNKNTKTKDVFFNTGSFFMIG
ncbi:MAG: hypothetical protein DMG67_19140 [Acidobacteria bacterium]|nr:MAG: hypothetical protein DMG67_19140 [Acidobacteriota bacterium]